MGGQRVPLTTPTSGRLAVPFFLAAKHSSLLDFGAMTAAVRGSSSRSLQSSPFSGAPLAPASGGSAPSSGGTGLQLSGALALLLIALLGGKFLWYVRDFLKPDSFYGLIVNQPG
jgi:hypothetical protein